MDVCRRAWPKKALLNADCKKTVGVLYAGVAQLAEQLICNHQVKGSSPFTSSNKCLYRVNSLKLALKCRMNLTRFHAILAQCMCKIVIGKWAI